MAQPAPLFKITNELRALVDRSCNETLTEPECERLNELLRGDAEAQSFYLAYLSIHARLSWELRPRLSVEATSETAAPAAPVASGTALRPPKRHRRSWAVVGSVAVTAVLAACVFLIDWTPEVAEVPPLPAKNVVLPPIIAKTLPEPPAVAEKPVHLAVLSGSVQRLGAATDGSIEIGQPLPDNRLMLPEGVAEVTFAGGVMLLLEGPGELEILDSSRGFLHVGKAVVRIPPGAEGFILETPSVDVHDLGTEFAIKVEPEGTTEVQVLDGTVVAYVKDADNNTFVERPMEAGQAIAVDTRVERPVREIPYTPERYVRELSAKRGLVLHYAFDKDEGERVCDTSWAENHGKPHGTKWTAAGRGPRNGACEFDGEESFIDAGAAPTLKMTDQVTVAAWLLPATFGNSRNPGNFRNVLSDHGTIENNGRILRLQDNRLEYLMGPEDSPEVGMELPATGRWYHAVATFDGAAMRLYVNGTQVAARPHVEEIPLNLGPILIGNSGFDEQFHGLLDDVMLYNRALNEKEVEQLYKAQGGK